MADSSEVVVDWFACCGYEKDAKKFVKSGINSIKKLRNLEEDQFEKIEPSRLMNVKFRRLQGRTSTGEELSQEVSVSVFVNVTKMYCTCGVECVGMPELGLACQSIAFVFTLYAVWHKVCVQSHLCSVCVCVCVTKKCLLTRA